MTVASGTERLDIEKIRGDFPILKQRPHGKPLLGLGDAKFCTLGRKRTRAVGAGFTAAVEVFRGRVADVVQCVHR